MGYVIKDEFLHRADENVQFTRCNRILMNEKTHLTIYKFYV